MDKITLGLMAVFMIAMALVVMPNVIALNRGRMLRNIALWLAVPASLVRRADRLRPPSHPAAARQRKQWRAWLYAAGRLIFIPAPASRRIFR